MTYCNVQLEKAPTKDGWKLHSCAVSYQNICWPLLTIWCRHRWVSNLNKSRCFYINFVTVSSGFQLPCSIPVLHCAYVQSIMTISTWLNLLGLHVTHAHPHSSCTHGLYPWRETDIHFRSNQPNQKPISASGSICPKGCFPWPPRLLY